VELNNIKKFYYEIPVWFNPGKTIFMKLLRGKFLVRKSTLKSGQDVLILSGTFFPLNFSTDLVDSGDEMWIADIQNSRWWN